MNKILRFLPLAALLFCFSLSAAVEVNSPSGQITGIQEKGAEVFKGIPFAKAPVGDLRFAPPAAAQPFDKPFYATSFCPVPVQPGVMGHRLSAMDSEDSLCLDIYRPKGTSSADKLPVYVWIYGGAFVAGASSVPLYHGASFAKQGIIVVNINYRLGPLGFFSSKTTLDRYGTTGNWGLMDMLCALGWVHENISDFGGDPDNITIGGESAGAYAASALILSPLAKGLFSRAILQSGTILNYPIDGFDARRNNAEAMKQSMEFLKDFGFSDDEDGLSRLRALDPSLISMHSYFDFSLKDGTLHIFKPYFDGYVLPADPYAALKNGNVNNVDVLLGYNTDEGTVFCDPAVKANQFERAVKNVVGSEDASRVAGFYTSEPEESSFQRLSRFTGDIMFNLGMKLFADNLSAKGHKVYMYHFAYGTAEQKSSISGIRHGLEICYAFNNLPAGATDEQRHVAADMNERFANFIKYGDPNMNYDHRYLIEWPSYEASNPAVLRFDSINAKESFSLKEELDFLKQYLLR